MFRIDLKTGVGTHWSHQSWYIKISYVTPFGFVYLRHFHKNTWHSFLAIPLNLLGYQSIHQHFQLELGMRTRLDLAQPKDHWVSEPSYREQHIDATHLTNLCWSIYTNRSSSSLNIRYKYSTILSVWPCHDCLKFWGFVIAATFSG